MRSTLAIMIALAAGGCSSTPQGSTYTDTDEGAMARVEEAASHNGIRVHWVNPPRKPAAQRETN